MKDKKFTIKVFLTNDCNLKCYDCTSLCDTNNEKWYADTDEILHQMQILHDKINNNIEEIKFFGGEPTKHKDIFKIAYKTAEIFKDNDFINFKIDTNGTNFLNNLSIDQLKILANKKILLTLGTYPTNYKYTQNFKQLLNNNNIPFDEVSIRTTFSKNMLSTSKKDKDTKCELLDLSLYDYYELFLSKNNIYACFKCVDTKFINIPSEQHYIDIYSNWNENDIYNLFSQPLTTCSYCNYSSDTIGDYGYEGSQTFPWHSTLLNKNQTTATRGVDTIELFISNYKEYFYLYHTELDMYKELFLNEQIENNLCTCTEFYSLLAAKHQARRFSSGIADIYIPITSNDIHNLQQYKEVLLNQNNINYFNLYIVLINLTREEILKIFQFFMPFSNEKLNIWFLKADSILQGYCEVYALSFCDKIFLLNLNKNISFMQQNSNYLNNNYYTGIKRRYYNTSSEKKGLEVLINNL